MSEMIYEIGFACRLQIDAHSLNNEGTVGNVIEPRTITLANGEKTDGISGEMLKHIHTEALWQLIKNSAAKEKLCIPCKKLSPMKADANEEVKKTEDVKALDEALKCILCDSHGFLVQHPTINRKSTVEFGWAIGLPNKFHRDMHVHTRVALGEKKRGVKEQKNNNSTNNNGSQSDSNQDETSEQMIYNRPTRSGIYAFISVFQPWRIGLNEINYSYAIEDNERKERYELVLDAYKAMMIRLEGAMTSTRLPHFEKIEGIIITTKNAMPVPIISPLSDRYIEETKTIAKQENVKEFSSLSDMVQMIDQLKSSVPYKLEEVRT